MTEPTRPRVQHQGPANNCVINGRLLGWFSCSAFGMGMGIDQATLGRKRPDGCTVREATGDTVGGLTLPQVAKVAKDHYGVPVELHVGSNVARTASIAAALETGRGVSSQGNTRVLIGKPQQSTNTGVNHFVHASFGRGWREVNGIMVPSEVYIYDPAADARRDMDDAPSWWPWALYLAFGAALRPWGDSDSRVLGAGKMYAGFLPDTEPHVHLKYGGVKTTPFPDRTRVDVAAGRKANVRTRPDRITASDVVAAYPDGTLFRAYQKTTTGAKPAGTTSRTWYGDHNGTRWIHESGLTAEGGTS